MTFRRIVNCPTIKRKLIARSLHWGAPVKRLAVFSL